MSQPASDDTMSQTSVTESITDSVYDAYATDSVADAYAVLQADAAKFAKKVFTCHSCAETGTGVHRDTCMRCIADRAETGTGVHRCTSAAVSQIAMVPKHCLKHERHDLWFASMPQVAEDAVLDRQAKRARRTLAMARGGEAQQDPDEPPLAAHITLCWCLALTSPQ